MVIGRRPVWCIGRVRHDLDVYLHQFLSCSWIGLFLFIILAKIFALKLLMSLVWIITIELCCNSLIRLQKAVIDIYITALPNSFFLAGGEDLVLERLRKEQLCPHEAVFNYHTKYFSSVVSVWLRKGNFERNMQIAASIQLCLLVIISQIIACPLLHILQFTDLSSGCCIGYSHFAPNTWDKPP